TLLDPARLVIGHHRRQLVQIAHQHQLYPAEGRAGPRAVQLERGGERIEQVRPHHRRLVDDERVQLLQRLREAPRVVAAAAHRLLGDAEREGEQAVDRVPVHVQRRDPRGRDRDRGALGGFEVVTDQRGLAGARLAGEEEVVAGVQVLERGGELVGDGQRSRRGRRWRRLRGGYFRRCCCRCSVSRGRVGGAGHRGAVVRDELLLQTASVAGGDALRPRRGPDRGGGEVQLRACLSAQRPRGGQRDVVSRLPVHRQVPLE